MRRARKRIYRFQQFVIKLLFNLNIVLILKHSNLILQMQEEQKYWLHMEMALKKHSLIIQIVKILLVLIINGISIRLEFMMNQ